MGSYQSATGYDNFSINGATYNYLAGAISGAGGQGSDPGAIADAFFAVLSNQTVSPISSVATASCSNNGASNVGDCATIAVDLGTLATGLSTSGVPFYASIVVVNNTQFSLSTSSNISDQQCWANNGSCAGGPSNAVPPVTASAISGSLYEFIGNDAFEGPNGAVWISVDDPDTGTFIGGLCVAFSTPFSGSNEFAVAWNQVVSTFAANATTLQVATIFPPGYPIVWATANISDTSGDFPVIYVTLNQSPLPDGILVSVPGAEPVYQVILGQACQIPDPPTAENLYGAGWPSIVQSITQADLTATPPGPMLTSGACLVQGGSAAVFLYTWGSLFGITSMNVLGTYGFNGAIQAIPSGVLQAMPVSLVLAPNEGNDGTFLQYDGNDYVILLGQALGIPNDGVTGPGLFGSAWNPSAFQQVDSLPVPPGPTLTSGACLIQGSGLAPQYLYSGGLRMWIGSAGALGTYSFAQPPNAVPGDVIQAIPQGLDINY